jgi:hypothetical protein
MFLVLRIEGFGDAGSYLSKRAAASKLMNATGTLGAAADTPRDDSLSPGDYRRGSGREVGYMAVLAPVVIWVNFQPQWPQAKSS